MKKQRLGTSGLSVTSVAFGASALGNMPDTYGYEVSEARAQTTLQKIFDGPVNFLDTSNNYGLGRSESRIGQAIKARGGLPEGFVLATKLDRDMQTGCFDADRVARSIEESLTRLGLDCVPLLHLHDPEHARDLNEVTRDGGAIDALFKLKEQGLVTAVGLAMGALDIMFPILKAYPFDSLISHNRFTLLNRSAGPMFDYAQTQSIAVFNAAPYAGGVLAKGSHDMPKITYQPADGKQLKPIRVLEEICARHNIPLGAAALQFSLKESCVTSTIVGVSRPERIDETLEWAALKIPEAALVELAQLSYDLDDPEANRLYKPG